MSTWSSFIQITNLIQKVVLFLFVTFLIYHGDVISHVKLLDDVIHTQHIFQISVYMKYSRFDSIYDIG